MVECMVRGFNLENGLPCSPPPVLTNGWYANESECVRECNEDDSCGGRAPFGAVLYSTFDECCTNHFGLIENSPCPSAM